MFHCLNFQSPASVFGSFTYLVLTPAVQRWRLAIPTVPGRGHLTSPPYRFSLLNVVTSVKAIVCARRECVSFVSTVLIVVLRITTLSVTAVTIPVLMKMAVATAVSTVFTGSAAAPVSAVSASPVTTIAVIVVSVVSFSGSVVLCVVKSTPGSSLPASASDSSLWGPRSRPLVLQSSLNLSVPVFPVLALLIPWIARHVPTCCETSSRGMSILIWRPLCFFRRSRRLWCVRAIILISFTGRSALRFRMRGCRSHRGSCVAISLVDQPEAIRRPHVMIDHTKWCSLMLSIQGRIISTFRCQTSVYGRCLAHQLNRR